MSESREEKIRALVESAPPLSDSQRAKLSMLLNPSGTESQGDE